MNMGFKGIKKALGDTNTGFRSPGKQKEAQGQELRELKKVQENNIISINENASFHCILWPHGLVSGSLMCDFGAHAIFHEFTMVLEESVPESGSYIAYLVWFQPSFVCVCVWNI